MPRKKLEEKEEELDVKKQEKKETYATRWFKDHAVNNASDLKIICELTARAAKEQFDMRIISGNTEVYGVIFYGTFMTILDWLREKQKKNNMFTIEIGKSINIGFTNNVDDDENEKVGNFMPLMEYIGINRSIVDNGETDESSSNDKVASRCISWKSLNLKKTIEEYNMIQEVAYERLRTDYKTDIRTSEAVIPLFCIFMDNISNMIRYKFKEAEGTDVSEVSMNVFGLFDVYYSFNAEDNQEIIEFAPSVAMKLALKSDDVASRDK